MKRIVPTFEEYIFEETEDLLNLTNLRYINQRLDKLGRHLPSVGYIGGGNNSLFKIDAIYTSFLEIRSILMGKRDIENISQTTKSFTKTMTAKKSQKQLYNKIIREFIKQYNEEN